MKRFGYRAAGVLKILFACCFLVCIAWTIRLYYVEYQENAKREELSAIHANTTYAGSKSAPEASSALEETTAFANNVSGEDASLKVQHDLSGINPDYLGWLTVYGTQTDLPVVLGSDNTYYLNHDFYGKRSSYGTLFADCLTDRSAGGNLLIYGHHMKNGSMFGELTSFCDSEFFCNHDLLRWEDASGSSYYEIFASLVLPGYEDSPDYLEIRDYLGTIPPDRQEELLATLKARSLLWRDLTFSADDTLLFLMTCDYTRKDGRLLLCARRVGGE